MVAATQAAAVEYAARGWALVPLGADKRPTRKGWSTLDGTVRTVEQAASLRSPGVGLAHAFSGTCCVDVDDFDAAYDWLEAHGVYLDSLMAEPDAVRIESGRPGRGKLLYRLPEGLAPLRTRKPVPGLELRCASSNGNTVQDALPPSPHPITGQPYKWAGAGDWRRLPVLPAALLAAWNAEERATPADLGPTEPVGLTDDAIRLLLSKRDPDCSYDEWIKVGMALHHETRGEERGLALWDAWSEQSAEKYHGLDDLEKHYESFGRGDGPSVTIRSLMGALNVADPDEFAEVVAELEAEAELEADEDEDDRLLSFSEFAARPSPGWLIKGILPKAALIVIYGEPGSGKSFAIMDMAGCLARGVPWNGQRVKGRYRVCYIAAEGAGGLTLRAQAYALKNPGDLGAFLFYPRALDLLTTGHARLAKLIEAAGGADLIIVDTLAQSMPGGNENASEDMGKVIAHCGKLHRATGATVCLVHHSGKDMSRGARGWSGLKGAADAEIEVLRDGPARTLRVGKQKDGADGAEFPFRLETVHLGTDDDGDAVTSCVVEWLDPAEVRREREPGGVKQKLLLRIIREVADLGDGTVPVNTALAAAVKASPEDDPENARRALRRALENLREGGYITIDDGQITLT